MLRRIFVLFFCVFCIMENSSLFGMKIDDRVVTYLKNNATVCFNSKLHDRSEIERELVSSKIGDIVGCVAICGTLIKSDLFGESDKLPQVIHLISEENIQSAMGTSATVNVFLNLKKRQMIEDNLQENDFRKLALFAPTATKKLKLTEWLSKFDNLLEGKSNNYELKSFSENYTLELALCMIFSPVSFSFWDSNANKLQYVQNMCGAIRSYLHIVEGIDIKPLQGKPSYFSVLEQCYSFYFLESKKNR